MEIVLASSVAVPLHKALDAAAAQVGQHDVNHSSDTEQAYMLADYITDRTFHDGWKVLADLSELEAQNETAKRHRAAAEEEWHVLQTDADANAAKAKIDLQRTEAAIKVNECKVTLHR